ncbi:unnamed protein product [Amoebophrya sp. A25]|nr:unnamed protein product [Amoebophrya sp. A25]|eukprot:GSA25T00014289001.1
MSRVILQSAPLRATSMFILVWTSCFVTVVDAAASPPFAAITPASSSTLSLPQAEVPAAEGIPPEEPTGQWNRVCQSFRPAAEEDSDATMGVYSAASLTGKKTFNSYEDEVQVHSMAGGLLARLSLSACAMDEMTGLGLHERERLEKSFHDQNPKSENTLLKIPLMRSVKHDTSTSTAEEQETSMDQRVQQEQHEFSMQADEPGKAMLMMTGLTTVLDPKTAPGRLNILAHFCAAVDPDNVEKQGRKLADGNHPQHEQA